jgi:hypothetical protein
MTGQVARSGAASLSSEGLRQTWESFGFEVLVVVVGV